MNARRAVKSAFLMIMLATLGCGREADRPSEDDEVSGPEQMAPASGNRPAGIGREDVTPTPGTRPTGTEPPEDEIETRDRVPPQG